MLFKDFAQKLKIVLNFLKFNIKINKITKLSILEPYFFWIMNMTLSFM